MKKLLNLIFTIVLISGLISCEKNADEPNNKEFDVPELTLLNTIQFTVDTRSGYTVEFGISGSMMAVDWGDGEIATATDPRTGYYVDLHSFKHTYKSAGKYRIKIWTEKLTKIRVSGLLRDYGDLHVGTCPVLKDAVFNSLTSGKSVNLNGCKQLEELELGNWTELESATIDECSKLKGLFIYTNPAMMPLDLEHNSDLRSVVCQDCAMDIQKLPKNIVSLVCHRGGLNNVSFENFKELTSLDCSYNDGLTTLNITDCDKLSILNFSNTRIGSFDFSECPQLTEISCGKSGLTTVNVGANKKLTSLYCSGLNLVSLDVTNNTSLGLLDCSDNKLTVLDVSANKYLNRLYIDDNLFGKDGLETIFKALPSSEQLPQSLWPMHIKLLGNPGAAACDTKIITDKGWLIRDK